MGNPIPDLLQIPLALSNMVSGYMKTRALYVAARLGIADHLRNGPQRSEELAEAVGAHPKALYLLLRALTSLDLFSEPEPGLFGLTPLGEHLCKDAPSGFYSYVLMTDTFWSLWGELPYTLKTGQSADWQIWGMSSFDHLQQHPNEDAAFHEAMTLRVSTFAPAVVAAYDFSAFRTITDIGGGHGALLATILRTNPQARGILFDTPQAIEGAQQGIKQRGLAERCTCVGGDFFREIPGGDALILSAVISDWNEDKSVQILSNCRRAIAPEGRLLLIERRLSPEKPASPMAFLDLTLFVGGGGTGRTEAEYRHLLKASGFDLLQVYPTRTEVSVFEAKPV